MPEENVSTETLRLSNGSFGRIANLKSSGGDVIYAELLDVLQNKNATSADIMVIAKKIAPDSVMHGILLDAIAYFGLAELYPIATHAIADMKNLYLEPEIGIFKILMEIKKCL